MDKPTRELLENLLASLKKIGQHMNADLTNRPEWGSITFENAQGSINTVCSQATELAAMPLDSLDANQANEIQTATQRIIPVFEEIASFTLEGEDAPRQRRDDIVYRFEQESRHFFSVYYKHIPYLGHRQGNYSADVRDIKDARAKANSLLESASDEISSMRQELNRIIADARSAAPDAAIPSFAEDFKKEANQRQGQARIWLSITGLLYALAICVLVYLASALPTDTEGKGFADFSYHLIIKLPFVAIFLTGAFWCSRHYSITKQQVVVNRHRAHSIRTFRAFVAAASDPAVKDIVLTKTVECVFVHVPTGLTRGQDSSQNQRQILIDVGKTLNRTATDEGKAQE